MKWFPTIERVLLIGGVLTLGFHTIARIDRAVSAQAALHRFKMEQLSSSGQAGRTVAEKPAFALWSEQRIRHYEDSLSTRFPPALAILRIPKIHLEVPVLEGTDELVLNRGVGRIQGTANTEDDGNIGIAGHRDGFFRGLKDIGPGDTIEVVTAKRTRTYTVDRVVIVDRQDVSVLAPSRQPSLTLVTCYPFYFVGSAPQRYIVHGSVAHDSPGQTASGARSHESPESTAAKVSSKIN